MRRSWQLVLVVLCIAPVAAAEPLFPFVLPWDDASPGLVNLAPWNEPVRPVTISPAGHFQAGSDRIRFLGVNLVFGACFPRQEDAPKIAARLAKFGINIVRFHHMDMNTFPGGIRAQGGGLDPEALARLDLFIAELKKQGIYVNLNLLVSRPFGVADGLPADFEKLGWKERGLPAMFHSGAIDVQKLYARQLLSHVNPHTGLSYAEDPVVATVEIHNENGLLHGWLGGQFDQLPAALQRDLQLQWNVWLRRQYGTREKLQAAWNVRVQPRGDEMVSLTADRWLLEQHNGAQASVQITNGLAEIQVTQPGRQDWHVQWNRPGLMLNSNQSYTLSFRAKADAPRALVAAVGEAHEPWGDLGLRATAALTGEWQQFRFVFNARATDARARVLFSGLGTSTGRVWLSEVSLRSGGVSGLGENERFDNATVPVLLKARIGERTEAAQRDWLRFLWETEDRYWQGMKLFLKDDLKVRAPIIGTIVGCSTPNLMGRLDAIDTHAYWQHPQFPRQAWDPADWTVGNRSMVNEPGGVLPDLALKRVLGKPHCVTEYNHAAPNPHGAEAFPLLAAYAALQDWDAIYAYSYAHGAELFDARKIPNFFDIGQHPLKMASLVAAAALFRRADVLPAREQIVVPLDKERELELLRRAHPWTLVDARHQGVPREVALVHRVALKLGKGPVPSLPKNDQLRADTGELNWEPGLVTINTAKSKAVIGFGGGKSVVLGNLTIEPGASRQGGWSVITATELAPGRWLICALGYAENTAMGWTDPSQTSVGRNWGQAPSLVEGVPARLRFGQAMTAWALDERGQRRQALPAGQVLELGPQYKTIWYEVQVAH